MRKCYLFNAGNLPSVFKLPCPISLRFLIKLSACPPTVATPLQQKMDKKTKYAKMRTF